MTDLQMAILALLNLVMEKQDSKIDVLAQIEQIKKIAFPYEKDPHAELKAQYALDVELCKDIEGLYAWQLWQYRYSFKISGRWFFYEDDEINYDNDGNVRRHPHADSIIAYHKGSDADKNLWQYLYRDSWLDCDGDPDWCENTPAFRLKPETITINGKEYNAPMRVAPTIGTEYWIIGQEELLSSSMSIWDDDEEDFSWLNNRQCFAAEQDCQAVADAFNAILRGDKGFDDAYEHRNDYL